MSKSHTVYGLRAILASIHPDNSVVERITTVMGVTGRQIVCKFAAGSYSILKFTQIVNQEQHGRMKGAHDRDTETAPDLFIATCQKLKVPINPTRDGFLLASMMIQLG